MLINYKSLYYQIVEFLNHIIIIVLYNCQNTNYQLFKIKINQFFHKMVFVKMDN